jgi:hypothetical protein
MNRQSEVEQDRQCTYNVTLWRVRITIVPVETRQCTPCAVDNTSVLPFYIIAALPDDGRHYQPEHVVVNVTNGYIVIYTGLFEMIVGILTTCHAQYT